jgi:hypothetical protein
VDGSSFSNGWKYATIDVETSNGLWRLVETRQYIDPFHIQHATPSPKSNGGSTDYYDIPAGAKDLQDLIEHRGMNFAEGNVFKAVYRLGKKTGTDRAYDWNKIIWFAHRELQRCK